MKYMVSMEEINFGGVVVEASSAEEAREKAEQEYENGNVFWKNTGMEITSVQRKKDRGDAR